MLVRVLLLVLLFFRSTPLLGDCVMGGGSCSACGGGYYRCSGGLSDGDIYSASQCNNSVGVFGACIDQPSLSCVCNGCPWVQTDANAVASCFGESEGGCEGDTCTPVPELPTDRLGLSVASASAAILLGSSLWWRRRRRLV